MPDGTAFTTAILRLPLRWGTLAKEKNIHTPQSCDEAQRTPRYVAGLAGAFVIVLHRQPRSKYE
jgi:hypothetical protein